MVVPVLILALSLIGVAVALLLPGYGDLILLAGPCTIAALILLWRALFLRITASAAPEPETEPNRILIDGSNVMYWRDNTPRIETLREVIGQLRRIGFAPGVVFDANAGYLLTGKYKHDDAMAGYLGLAEDWVMVVPKGTVADRYLLTVARDVGAPIVTNDRYRDWAADYPEIKQSGRLIRGGYRDGALWFEGMDIPT
ncbi:NYN domain-containing protein [Roseovarius mucosus]|uniref:NYN domain-containing protein n=1 Tax=Roseovarius mucosus TaxID=215743 RepID=UPI003F6F9588